MKGTTKRILLIGLAVLMMIFSACGADTPANPSTDTPVDFPTDTIEMIVCSTAGGGSDLLARALAESVQMPKPMVIVNRAGAGGTLGTTEVAKSKADGYTLLLGMVGPFETQPHLLDVQYSIDDFRYITGLTNEEFYLAVKSDSGIKSIEDLVAAYKDKELSFGSSSVGSVPHLAQEYLFKELGLSAKNIPFSGSNEVIVNLIGGHIDAAAAQYGELVNYVESGELTLIGMFSKERSEMAPDVPTITEQGYDVAFSAIKFVAAPKDTPEEVVTYLREQFEQAKQTESFTSFLDNIKTAPCNLSEDEIKAQLTSESEIYGELIDQLGLKK